MKFNILQPLLCVVLFCSCKKDKDKAFTDQIVNDIDSVFTYEPTKFAEGIKLGVIYKTTNFAAFTDIAYYHNSWYVVFRAGTSHAKGQAGKIKVLKSKDGVNWKVSHIIALPDVDLRDPKLTIDTLNDELYMSFFGLSNKQRRNFLTEYNAGGSTWSSTETIDIEGDPNSQHILWRLTYHKNRVYSAAYKPATSSSEINNNIGLYESEPRFRRFKQIGRLDLAGDPNEATIRFDSANRMYFIIRTEASNSPIGISEPPFYHKVKWVPDAFIMRVSSPNFLFYKGKLLITGRDGKTGVFKLFSYDLKTMKVQKVYTLPSGKETGYAGMSFNPDNPDELFVSYYAILPNESVIYLAKVNMKIFL